MEEERKRLEVAFNLNRGSSTQGNLNRRKVLLHPSQLLPRGRERGRSYRARNSEFNGRQRTVLFCPSNASALENDAIKSLF